MRSITRTSYQYDANGNRTLTDANGKVTQLRLRCAQPADAGHRRGRRRGAAIATTPYGNRTSMTDANSHITTYSYDALNRLATRHRSAGQRGQLRLRRRGQPHQPDQGRRHGDHLRLRRGQPADQPTGRHRQLWLRRRGQPHVHDRYHRRRRTYTYDALDRLTQVAGPNGTLSYGYDLNGNRTSVTYPGSLTVSLRLRRCQPPDDGHGLRSTGHDLRLRRCQPPDGHQYPNGVQAVYNYDNADRLLSLVHTHPSQRHHRHGHLHAGQRRQPADHGRPGRHDHLHLRQPLPADAGDLPRRRDW